MAIYILDNTLKVEICFSEADRGYRDNICVQIIEDCPRDEKLFLADETNLFLTPEEALRLAETLRNAARASLGLDDN